MTESFTDTYITLTLAHEYNQSPNKMVLNTHYIIQITEPPSYDYRAVSYGRPAPYPTNTCAVITYELQHGYRSEYVTETPEQILKMIQEAQND